MATNKSKQEAVHMRMATTAHATLRMGESNERMRSLLDEFIAEQIEGKVKECFTEGT